jgi:truncated hemoglobin YjbI
MMEVRRRRLSDLKPDPEMWAALDGGERLTAILQDFYERAYVDPRLSPFFEGVTRQRAIEKQYSFLRQIFTGEDVYFGDRPSNAHHWMVISEDLFDHREALMESCLRRHGLPEHLVARWGAVEEVFRKVIVKAAPRPRKIHGIELPVDGYGTVELAIGSLCDGCEGAMESGSRARYHLRTGRTYCGACLPDTGSQVVPSIES